MNQKAKAHEPVGQKNYINPVTGEKKKGAIVPLAKIRADEIWAQVRPYLDQHEPFGNLLLVAVYKQPEQRESGLYIPDSVREEDIWQGVTGLVIQIGPGCFQDTDKWKFYGQKAVIGEWITFQPSNTILCRFGGEKGRECRLIRDSYILGKAAGPHVVF